MRIYRKCTRGKMVTFKCISHHPCLFCAIVMTLFVTLSYVNNRLNQTVSYWRTFQEDSVIFQEQARRWQRNAHRVKSVEECEIFTLQQNHSSKLQHSGCQRIPPVPGSCDLADEIFFSEPQATCSHQRTFNFCELKKSVHGKWEVMCNETQSKACLSPLSVGRIHKHTGSLLWEESGTPAKTSEMLTSYVQRPSLTDSLSHYGFCFIRCFTKDPVQNENNEDFDDSLDPDFYSQDEHSSYAEQLLVLPPQLKMSDSQIRSSLQTISINVMLVDSVSRQHFFRSLPKSISALRGIIHSPGSGVTVLDFELVQAVRSRTFETLQTIFSGDVDPSEKPFGTQEIPPRPLRLSFLLEKFKKRGYRTLWIEDLCYLWEWGISKDLHFLNKSSSSQETWVRMWKKLSENSLDSVDITLAMCKVLKANKVSDHFHGPDSVCFNGRHQHEYLLEYLQLHQQEMESRKQPYFTFTMTNVAHEDSGRRVQTLDHALANYLKFTASLQNTLTVFFSDHGNAYGSFMRTTQEARIELFHPFMIFIVPKNVARILGNQAMKSLTTNSFRLVSFLDLHHTLNHIIDPGSSSGHVDGQFRVSRKGLIDPVDVNRTCDDIPRIMPNLCICQDYDTPESNSTGNNLFAYFAVGRLNDEIQRQLLLSQMKGGATLRSKDDMFAFKKCEKLTLVSVQNVRKSFDQNRSRTIKMDLHVQHSQVFFVAVSVKHNSHDQGDYVATLEMYDRITPYSTFSVCADVIDLSLCVCDISKTDSFSKVNIPQVNDFQNINLLPHFETLVHNINDDNICLYLVTVKHSSGGVIFSANSCTNKSFILTAVLEAEDQIIYFSPPKLPVVLPGGMVVLGFLFAETGDNWVSSVKVSFQVITDLRELNFGPS